MPTRIATTIPYVELEVADGNFDQTRAPINLIVVHTMAGTWQGAAARFDDPASQVSAHYGVKLDGGLIHWLEETYTAYHAGNYPINQRSIGIEHEDGGRYNDPRPDALYTSSAKLCADICRFYGFPADAEHIKPHHDFTATACPDALDVDRIIREAAALLKVTVSTGTVPVLNDKTLFDFGPGIGSSEILDKRREVSSLQSQLSGVTEELRVCRQTPPASPATPPTPVPPPPADSTPSPEAPNALSALLSAFGRWIQSYLKN